MIDDIEELKEFIKELYPNYSDDFIDELMRNKEFINSVWEWEVGRNGKRLIFRSDTPKEDKS